MATIVSQTFGELRKVREMVNVVVVAEDLNHVFFQYGSE